MYILFCNESIVFSDIKNVHNMSLLFIRTLKVNSIDYYNIIVTDVRKILSQN